MVCDRTVLLSMSPAVKVSLCLLLMLLLKPAISQQPAQTPHIQILTADVLRRNTRDEKGVNVYTIRGLSRLPVVKADVTMEEDGTGYAAYLKTGGTFTQEEADHIVVRVGDKILVPSEWGGSSSKVLNTVGFHALDLAAAETLNGGPLSTAPKESLKIEYTPDAVKSPGKSGVYTTILIINVGDRPITLFWGTTGGRNYPCRDTQLAFSASLDGVPTLLNPKPLPPGFISSPLTLQPKAFLRRHENLKEWLQLDKPGQYLVSANYTLNIQNPVPGANPGQWSVVYQNQFSVNVSP